MNFASHSSCRCGGSLGSARMFFRQPLRSDDLITWAQRRTGLSEFGSTPFQQGLQVFVRACTEEANLSHFGHLATRWDVGRLLSSSVYEMRRLGHPKSSMSRSTDQFLSPDCLAPARPSCTIC